jgi:hypothetical protein
MMRSVATMPRIAAPINPRRTWPGSNAISKAAEAEPPALVLAAWLEGYTAHPGWNECASRPFI